jgi:hypothetical protein
MRTSVGGNESSLSPDRAEQRLSRSQGTDRSGEGSGMSTGRMVLERRLQSYARDVAGCGV